MSLQKKNPLYLGVLGLSWKEKVAKEMLLVLKGTDYEDIIKSFWGGSGLNTGLVDTLHDVYLSYMRSGWNPPVFNGHIPDNTATRLSSEMESITQIPYTVNMEFLRSLYTLASNGTIDFKIYDPVKHEEIQKSTGEFNIQSFFESVSGKMNMFLIIGAITAGVYLLSNINSQKN